MTDEGDGLGWTALKWVLLGLGGLMAVGLVLKLIVPVLLLAGVVTVGALVHASISKNKRIDSGRDEQKTISAKSAEPDPERAKAELDAIKKKLQEKRQRQS